MKLVEGDIFKDWHKIGHWIGITTNGVVKTNGDLVMGAGVARQAAYWFPWLPAQAGSLVKRYGNMPFIFRSHQLVTFPTKYHFSNLSDLDLIERSATKLAQMILAYPSWFGEKSLVLAAPGIGYGGLRWSDVEGRLKALESLNVICITMKYDGG